MNDTSFHQQETDTKKPVGFFALLHWFARLLLLTEEEQDAAGIYPGRLYDNDQDR